MKVDKELIEKYHRDECTPEEAAAVETWLLDDESDELPELPFAEDAEIHKREMWANIEEVLPSSSAYQPKIKKLIPLWLNVAAACVVVAALGLVVFNKITAVDTGGANSLVEVDNSSAIKTRHVSNDEYQLSVGPGTSARIDNREGIIHFTGSMVIRPQRDIEFSFGTYPQKETFKSGETYILLDERRGDGRVTIVNERNLTDMPPVLQKRIITQFNI